MAAALFSHLQCVQSFADGVQIWTYETAEPLATIVAANYFKNDGSVGIGLRVGDHVHITRYTDTAKTAVASSHIRVVTLVDLKNGSTINGVLA